MEPQYNFFDTSHPLKPYTYTIPAGDEYTVERIPIPMPQQEYDDEGITIGNTPVQEYEEVRTHVTPPDNALLITPEFKDGFWPVLNAEGDGWTQAEDHRQKKDERGSIIEGSGTPYWLSGDSWDSQARYMDDIGPLPNGALLSAPEKSIGTIKEEKIQEIRRAFDNEESNGYVDSSLGFRADATRKSKADIDGLIQAMDAMDMQEVAFRDYDNLMRTLTFDQVRMLQLELIQKGLWNYSTKWGLEQDIYAAKNKEEVEAVRWPTAT